MGKSCLHIIQFAACLILLAGCAVYPVVQVAGGAMTGYDAAVMADEFLPRNSVEGGQRCLNNDRMLERRLRERLQQHHLPASAHVIDAGAYLVGEFPSRTQADHTVAVAKTVQGLRTITCKFYRQGTLGQSETDTVLKAKVASELANTKRLQDADLRVEVIQSTAIIMGRTANYEQKTAALAIASEVGGVNGVVDYICVPQAQTHTNEDNASS